MEGYLLHDGEISVLSILYAKDSLAVTEIVDLSGGKLNIKCVYAYLAALHSIKCIKVTGEYKKTVDGHVIQNFSITETGRRVLRENQSGPSGLPSQVPVIA